MVIGLAVVELRLYGVRSLKTKRSIIRPLTERIRNKFNVSVIESGVQDNWMRSELTIVCAAADAALAHSQLEKVVALVEMEANTDIIAVSLEIL